MDELMLPHLENVTERWEEGDEAFNSTAATSTAWENAAKQSVSAKALAGVSLIITSLGIISNTGVLAVLVRARRQFGNSVHTLITNQCAMDLFTSVFGMGTIVMMITHGYHYNRSNTLASLSNLLSGLKLVRVSQ